MLILYVKDYHAVKKIIYPLWEECFCMGKTIGKR
jgi:hypothetical protein